MTESSDDTWPCSIHDIIHSGIVNVLYKTEEDWKGSVQVGKNAQNKKLLPASSRLLLALSQDCLSSVFCLEVTAVTQPGLIGWGEGNQPPLLPCRINNRSSSLLTPECSIPFLAAVTLSLQLRQDTSQHGDGTLTGSEARHEVGLYVIEVHQNLAA